VLVTKAFT